MGDTHHHYHQTTTTSKFGVRNACGEIVEVQGGHIVRSIGRKDRHSKVCTAKGPRDRRVRLSAHTAIQFYDVQDRLGFDRPSKAVDWLIKKAKTAIDELAELPAWNPTTAENENFKAKKQQMVETVAGSSSSGKRCSNIQNQHQQKHMSENESSFLPPTMDSDAIKSFFPMGASAETNSSVMQFQSFAPPDLLSRTSSQSQDLRLSLQSFHDPVLLHHHQSHQSSTHDHQTQQALFSGHNQMGFDGSGWSEHQHGELGRFSRMLGWNSGGDNGGDGGGGFVFSSPPPTPPLGQPLFGQNQQFSQRGPLQSSNSPSLRAWIDPFSIAATDQHHHHQALPIHPSSISGIGFTSGGGFSGFRIPARIQGEEEEHDGVSDKPSSASSDSRH